MPGLTLYTSNRLEVLVEELAGILRRPGDPLKSDIVIVQSRGMERWLSLALARLNGIVANCQFPFPNAFIEDVFNRLFDFDAEKSPFQRNVLTFRIMHALPDLMTRHSDFEDLRTYLKDDLHGVKGFQLAAEIADLLDQYLIFRPRMLLDWEKSHQPDITDPFSWQPTLWKHLTRDRHGQHRAALWQALVTNRHTQARSRAGLPERVSLFGVSYLPPYYLQILQALAVSMTIDIYQLNPCQEYWADIASEREMERIRRRTPGVGQVVDLNTLHLETGNRLLASLGGHGREFHALIAELDCPVVERFEEHVPESLLEAVQHDLLHLTDHGKTKPGADLWPSNNALPDASIQVHACHGPMREIEVLQDQLLALLEMHPDLNPRDILVMTPDIETYAPFIQAVFGSPADERLYLPFSIADRVLESASPLVDAFNRLLDLRTSRFTRSEIMALLEFEPLRKQFGFDEADLSLIDDLISRVHIRWGIDGAGKSLCNLPAVDANTWRHGLDRLVLGYALHAEPDRFFQNLLPDDSIQGNQATAIGRLTDLVETLWEFSRDLDTPRTLSQWHQRIVKTLSEFFIRDERYEYDIQVLERLLGDIRHGSAIASFDTPVDLDIVRAYLNRRLSQEHYRGGFIAGGITFGALLPMRSIPAQIICLVGLNHDIFPRLDRSRSFDLMALNPQLGDRSRRSDDRYLFLEALISARRCLYLSYTGFDLHDNSTRPPSVLVSELVDYLQESFGIGENDLVAVHRMQAFSPAYFQGEDGRLFSFNGNHARAARNLAVTAKTRPDAAPFLLSALEKCPAEFMSLTPESLLEALGHPCRFLLERRLDLQLRSAARPEQDREAFELNALDQFQEGQWLTSRLLAGMPVEKAYPLQQARGILPHGEAGQSVSRRLNEDIEVFSDRMRPHVDERSSRRPRTYQIPLNGFLLHGRIDNLYSDGPVIFRYSKANGRALLGAWIQHLIFCHLATVDKTAGTTVLVCRDEVRRFNFIADSLPLLTPLLDIYFQAAHVPMPIFPYATPAFARQRIEKNKPATQAVLAAQRAWEGSLKVPGDKDDPYIILGFRGRDPWTEDFEDLAMQLYAPLFANSETIT